MRYCFLRADRAQAADVGRPRCRDAFDRTNRAHLAVHG